MSVARVSCMSTRASIRGHPVHAMLISIPIGLFVFSFVADLAFLVTGDARWDTVADFSLAGGVVGGLIAAVPGFIDYFGLTDPKARSTATAHMILNLLLVAVAAFNTWLRFNRDLELFPLMISAATLIGLVVSGALGGHLVHVLGVSQPGNEQTSGVEKLSRAREGRADATYRSG